MLPSIKTDKGKLAGEVERVGSQTQLKRKYWTLPRGHKPNYNLMLMLLPVSCK